MNQQMSKSKFISLWAILIICVCIITLVANPLTNRAFPKVNMIVYAAGTPDSYGNEIYLLGFNQNGTGSWTSVATCYDADYTYGKVLTINANQHTVIEIGLRLNITLAPNVATASTYARVYITVSGVTTSTLCTYNNGGSSIYYYTLWYYWPSTPSSGYTSTWIPSAATNYTVTLVCQAFY